MAHADDMVNIAESELEKLICKDAGGIGKAKERVVGKDSAQTHGPSMQDGLVAQAAQTGVTVDDANLFPQYDVAEDGEEGEDGREGGGAVYDQEGDVVDLEPVGQVSYASASLVGVGDDDDLVAPVYQLGRELVDVTLNPARLGEEEVADHGDVVRFLSHRGRLDLRSGFILSARGGGSGPLFSYDFYRLIVSLVQCQSVFRVTWLIYRHKTMRTTGGSCRYSRPRRSCESIDPR